MANNIINDKELKRMLWEGESVLLVVHQRRVGPGGSLMTPSTVVATDKRVIIINQIVPGGVRQDYEVIPYRQIASVRLEKGIISSSIFIRVQGYDMETDLKKGKQEGEIDGLNKNDAIELADMINKRIANLSAGGATVAEDSPDADAGKYIYCTQCGSKNDASAQYCEKCGAHFQQSKK